MEENEERSKEAQQKIKKRHSQHWNCKQKIGVFCCFIYVFRRRLLLPFFTFNRFYFYPQISVRKSKSYVLLGFKDDF